MEKEQKAILKAIDIMVEQKLKNLGFNYYVDGVIKEKNTDDTYNVLINGVVYNNIPSKNKLNYSINETVQILIKNGDWNRKFIDDVSNHKNPLVAPQPVGSIYIGETNTNPKDIFGGVGEWELIDKEFTPLTINTTNTSTDSFFTPNTDVIVSCLFRAERSGHTISVQMQLNTKPNAILGSEKVSLGTFDYSKLGITKFSSYITNRLLGYTREGNIVIGGITNASGVLQLNDIVDVDTVSNTLIYFDFAKSITSDRMIDSECNKFYWKRIA